MKLYEQKKSVKGVQNPPKGIYSKRNNRPEGYADYQPGMYYISAFSLTTDSPKETATTAVSTESPKPQPRTGGPRPPKRNFKRKQDGRTSAVRARMKAKVSRPIQRLLDRMIVDTTTWRSQQEYHRYQTKQKITPHLPANEWEKPVTTKFTITHGPRALGLNAGLIVGQPWAD